MQKKISSDVTGTMLLLGVESNKSSPVNYDVLYTSGYKLSMNACQNLSLANIAQISLTNIDKTSVQYWKC